MVDYLLTHGGTPDDSSSGEEFNHTLVVSTSNEDQADVAMRAVSAFIGAYTAGGGTLSAAFSGGVAWAEIRAARILDLSTGALFAASLIPMGGLGAVGTGTIRTAFSTALAVSLIAGTKPNGTPFRGRFYLPRPAGVQANGRILTTNRNAIRDFVGAWFDGLLLEGLTPGVWSRVRGNVQAVTAAAVGDVPDTMRSRRNALEENYSVGWPT